MLSIKKIFLAICLLMLLIGSSYAMDTKYDISYLEPWINPWTKPHYIEPPKIDDVEDEAVSEEVDDGELVEEEVEIRTRRVYERPIVQDEETDED